MAAGFSKRVCFECQDRHPACWSKCVKYAEEKAKSDEIRKARQRDLTYDKEIRDVQYHGLKRRR